MQPRRGEEGRGGGEEGERGGSGRGGEGRGEGRGGGKRRGGKGRGARALQGRCNGVSKEQPNSAQKGSRRDEYREATNPHDEREECIRVSKEQPTR